ncbi:MAG: nucleotidyl transferase AbiEii/AbiGii toxin family protein [Salinivirgaceae bacterium]|nr:nucleotidyl transferase AbiEii/AbiGii toxin family protein [Salinivirgaceae bacterium]
MLYTETIEGGTLELLRNLQSEVLLSSFNLVGGTSLALRMGHRKSVDLDLFTKDDFDLQELRELLVNKYDLRVSYEKGKTLKGFINNVKIDLIKYDYPQVCSVETIEGIRFESIPDVIAMKLSAICDNGSRMKDFIDIAFLSSKYSFDDMLKFYSTKFPASNQMMLAKALVYFADIDFNEDIVMLKYDFNWDKIAKRLNDMTLQRNKVFDLIS